MNATSRDPEQLERTAEQIRADLDRTLDALERKLSPSQLLDRSLEYLRDHSGELTRNVGEAVRRHPLPVVLAVAGIGWLVASTLRSREVIDDDTFGDESPYADRPVRSRFARAADATRARTRRTQYRVVSQIERQPLLLGGIAIALGALLGAVIPATEYEDRIVGELRDRAVERAKKMGERQYQNLRSRLETHRDVEVSGRAH
jgi:ElaB/YqjD/DUF883 family membrane-anchored ribosome-binding protein